MKTTIKDLTLSQENQGLVVSFYLLPSTVICVGDTDAITTLETKVSEHFYVERHDNEILLTPWDKRKLVRLIQTRKFLFSTKKITNSSNNQVLDRRLTGNTMPEEGPSSEWEFQLFFFVRRGYLAYLPFTLTGLSGKTYVAHCYQIGNWLSNIITFPGNRTYDEHVDAFGRDAGPFLHQTGCILADEANNPAYVQYYFTRVVSERQHRITKEHFINTLSYMKAARTIPTVTMGGNDSNDPTVRRLHWNVRGNHTLNPEEFKEFYSYRSVARALNSHGGMERSELRTHIHELARNRTLLRESFTASLTAFRQEENNLTSKDTILLTRQQRITGEREREIIVPQENARPFNLWANLARRPQPATDTEDDLENSSDSDKTNPVIKPQKESHNFDSSSSSSSSSSSDNYDGSTRKREQPDESDESQDPQPTKQVKVDQYNYSANRTNQVHNHIDFDLNVSKRKIPAKVLIQISEPNT